MRVDQLRYKSRFRVILSQTEMSALRKIVELGVSAIEEQEADNTSPLTTAERKAIAYWFPTAKQPHRRLLTPDSLKEAE